MNMNMTNEHLEFFIILYYIILYYLICYNTYYTMKYIL